MVASVAVLPKQRRPTKPTRSSQKVRLEKKTMKGQVKVLRRKIVE
jgi:ribosome-associated protein